jgi:glycosyltransferase involved in cell wall biosynthesis
MRVILSVASFHADHGGPPRSVSCLAAALAQAGLTVGVWAPDQSAGDTEFLSRDCGVQRLLGNEADALAQFGDVDLIHDNGIWLPHNHRLAGIARTLKIPRVVSIRGMLEPWALNHKRWKKRLAWHIYQKRDLRTAAVLHATAASEAAQLERLRLDIPVRVVSNGVHLPPASCLQLQSGGPRTALFLGRMHPKKGLPLLVEAWARVRPAGWRMRVVGPQEGGHRAALEALVAQAGLAHEWEFAGALEGTAKRQAFEAASLFILPTYSENFGIAVAEALAHGLPVITTRGAPWPGLQAEGCGWWTPVTVEGLATALTDATRCSPDELRAMGGRGREWMGREYTWNVVAGGMRRMYEEVLS